MNRRTFIARCASVVAAVLFPWKATSGPSGVSPVAAALEDVKVLNAEASFMTLASKFHWSCEYSLSKDAHLMRCWGELQDGFDYQCAEYIDLDREYVDGVWYDADPEAILRENVITFDKAMRRRFEQIENDRAESS